MAEQRISVRIARDGQVSAETHGMTGTDCLPYINVLEELLEAQAVDSRHTQEFHEHGTVSTHVREEQRLEDQRLEGRD